MEYYGAKTEPNRARIEFGWAVLLCRMLTLLIVDDILFIGCRGSYNVFAYCGNTPIVSSDSSGQTADFAAGAIAGVAASIIGKWFHSIDTVEKYNEYQQLKAPNGYGPFTTELEAVQHFSAYARPVSAYIHHELAAWVYQNPNTSGFYYTAPAIIGVHGAYVNTIRKPDSGTIVALAHSHTAMEFLSEADENAACVGEFGIYVITPSGALKSLHPPIRYAETKYAEMVELSDIERTILMNATLSSWIEHMNEGRCQACENKTHPRMRE